MRIPRLDLNFYKVIVGVSFSLLWAKVMYLLWDQPSYITFIWFYLGIGSIVLKWVLFGIMDRIHTNIRLRAVKKELDQSTTRVEEAGKGIYEEQEHQVTIDHETSIDMEEKLKQLEQNVLYIGNMVEKAVEQTIEGLKRRDAGLATQIVKNDQALDRKEFAIREGCLRLIANSQPKGRELRRIVAVLGIITELERMGDYAKGIANISLMIGTQPLIKPLIDIRRMTQIGIEMMRGSLESFLNRDVEKAKRICRMDDDVDALYDQIFRELVLYMIEDPKTITQATRLIWVAHNLERFADRTTNICEHVVYSVTGEMVDIGASKY